MLDFSRPLILMEQKARELALLSLARDEKTLESLKAEARLYEEDWDSFDEEIKIENGLATVKIHGVLLERADWFDYYFFGGISTTIITEKLKAIALDSTIKMVVFDIDSPGGEVGGVQNLAKSIRALSEDHGKKTIAYVNSLACSGGYWISAACDEIILSSQTATVGSIGVVILHREFSEFEKKIGVKTTEITAGKYKRAVSNYEKLSDEGKKILIERAGDIYQVFMDDVAKYRADSLEKVESYAEGLVFIGEKALAIGIADSIEYISSFEKRFGGFNLDINELKEKHPAIYAEALEIGVSGERKRVGSILEIKTKGYENAKVKAIKDGRDYKDLAVSIVQGQEEEDLKAPEKDSDKGKDKETEEEKKEREEKEKKEKEEAIAKAVAAALHDESSAPKSRFSGSDSGDAGGSKEKLEASIDAMVAAANAR